MDDIEFITDEDKNDISYTACVGGATIVGAAVGAHALGIGSLVGGLAGLAIGLKACGYLSKPIRQKIFDQNAKLSDLEIIQSINAIKKLQPQLSKQEALAALAGLRRSNYS